MRGYTSRMDFFQKVYTLCQRIPKGNVTTYKIIAHALGSKGYQAIGQVLKKNDQPEHIPCYRVVKSDGSIGGYHGDHSKNILKKIKKLKADGITVKNGKVNLKKHLFSFE